MQKLENCRENKNNHKKKICISLKCCGTSAFVGIFSQTGVNSFTAYSLDSSAVQNKSAAISGTQMFHFAFDNEPDAHLGRESLTCV